MRVLMLARPQFPLPPEQMPNLIQGFKAWYERHRPSIEAGYFFAGGGGGFGIFNVPDEAALNQIMLEWPLQPFSDIEVRPLLDVETALQHWEQALQAAQAGR
ncbi:MAG: hypothetical protein HY329_06670 [Chloroflexi bacterium]|nr:hypothetical protein [Chloroflexota bacterium]